MKISTYWTLIWTAVLYGCETWRLLREEPRLRVIGNGMLRNVLKPKEQVKGGWIKLHYANLYDWHPVKILTRWSNRGCYGRGMRDAWEEQRFAQDFGGKSQIKITLGRSGSGWMYNIQIDVTGLGWEDPDWSQLAWERERCQAEVWSVMNLRFP